MTATLRQLHDISSTRAHPVLHALRTLKSGTCLVTLPGGKEIYYEGTQPGTRADLRINHWDALDFIHDRGDIGFGEGYVQGLWDTPNLRSLMQYLADNIEAVDRHLSGSILNKTLYSLKRKLRAHTPATVEKNTHSHYEIGNDFYKLWLDRSLSYSGGLFEGDADRPLEDAQLAKHKHILDRLAPKVDDHILELGCGWGGFMREAAKNGHRVTGVTPSQSQAALAKQRLENEEFGERASVKLQDFRQVDGRFDHIVSGGVLEYIGEENWSAYMQKVRSILKPSGKALIQSVVVNDNNYNRYRLKSDFVREHMFPGAMLPSATRFREEAELAGLKVNDMSFFGPDYSITLERWLKKFDDNIGEIRDLGHDEAFIRKWRLYLASSAALFKAGRVDLMQAELTAA